MAYAITGLLHCKMTEVENKVDDQGRSVYVYEDAKRTITLIETAKDQ